MSTLGARTSSEGARLLAERLPKPPGRRIEVPFGRRAVLFDGGRYMVTLPAGPHRLDSWRPGGESKAVLVDDSSFELATEKVLMLSGVGIRLSLSLRLRITTPEVFLQQQVLGRERYRLDDLTHALRKELLREAVDRAVGRSPQDLLGDPLARRELENRLYPPLQSICEGSGLLLESVRLDFAGENERIEAEFRERFAFQDGNRKLLEKRLAAERLELEHEIESRRKVAEQRLEERRLWFEQQREEQSFAREEQMKKLWEMARIHEMQRERRGEEQRRDERLRAELEKERNQRLEGLSLETMITLTIANHPERAGELAAALEALRMGELGAEERKLYKERIQELQNAQRLDHEKFLAMSGSARATERRWQVCGRHGIKYNAVEGPCPLCEDGG